MNDTKYDPNAIETFFTSLSLKNGLFILLKIHISSSVLNKRWAEAGAVCSQFLLIKVRSKQTWLSDTLILKRNQFRNQFLNHGLLLQIIINLQDFFHWHCLIAIFSLIRYLPHIYYELLQMEKDSRSNTLSKGIFFTKLGTQFIPRNI